MRNAIGEEVSSSLEGVFNSFAFQFDVKFKQVQPGPCIGEAVGLTGMFSPQVAMNEPWLPVAKQASGSRV